ncbi:hypothetical protein O3G_MSEX012421 [Manduca sexta]|uniref:Uncharacterized protein n=1 Tax=Manduca sexta TaxID=7130 RepID=A0A922CX28_MANSE|nr:hypothetical protein O3G_MSEX012421 [Manduca sexta]
MASAVEYQTILCNLKCCMVFPLFMDRIAYHQANGKLVSSFKAIEKKYLFHLTYIAVLNAVRLKTSSKVGEHYDSQVSFTCDNCELLDVLCNGESVLSGGRITVVQGAKLVSFNFPSFDDTNSCVYMGLFKKDSKIYRKILAVFESKYLVRWVSSDNRVRPYTQYSFNA